MDARTLGRTGVKVSPLCLGAMMFGAWGNPDHDDSRRDHPRRARRRDQLHRHRRRVLGGRVRGDRRQGARRPARRRRARHQGARRHGHGPQPTGATRAAGSSRSARTACAGSAPTTSTSTRSTGPIPTPTSTRRSARSSDLVHQGKVRYLGSSTFPASEIVEAQWTAERRGRERFVCEQPPYSILVRGIEADVLPTCERYGMGVIPWSPLAGGWLSGKWRKGADPQEPARRARSRPLRPHQAREPAQARRGRRARDAGRRGRHHAGAPRGRVGHRTPRGHRRDHRAAHDGAAHQPARCRRP